MKIILTHDSGIIIGEYHIGIPEDACNGDCEYGLPACEFCAIDMLKHDIKTAQ